MWWWQDFPVSISKATTHRRLSIAMLDCQRSRIEFAATKHRIISGLQYHSEMSDAVLDTMSMCIHWYIGLICSHSFTFHAASSSTFPRRSCETSAQERTAASAKFGASMLIVGSYQNSQFCGSNSRHPTRYSVDSVGHATSQPVSRCT